MDTEDIWVCSNCGVLYSLNKCKISEPTYYCGEQDGIGECICPVCKTKEIYE